MSTENKMSEQCNANSDSLDVPMNKVTRKNGTERIANEKAEEVSEFLDAEQSTEQKLTCCGRLRINDGRQRHKYLHTACLCLSMMAVGWRLSMTGPTLPDLRLILNENLANASWLISALAFGGLVGSMSSGVMYDRFNKYLVFVVLTFCFAVFTAVTPWCSSFVPMLAIHTLTGVCAGGIDTIVSAEMVAVWGKKSAPFLQAMNLAFSVGAMISPLTSEPFLANRQVQSPDSTYTMNITAFPTSTSQRKPVENTIYGEDYLNTSLTNLTYENDHIYQVMPGPIRIHMAYVIAASVCLLPCLAFITEHMFVGNVHTLKYRATNDPGTDDQLPIKYPLSKHWRITFVLILSVLLSLYLVVVRTFYNYLATFLIERLYWSKTEATNATTTFWIAFSTAKLLAVFVVKVLRIIFVFILCLAITLAAGMLMLLAVRLNIPFLVWISCVVYGIGLSALLANILTFISTKVCSFTGKVSSVVNTITITGAMIFPLITGNVMTAISYDWFVYLEIILTCVLIVLYTVVEIIYRILTP